MIPSRSLRVLVLLVVTLLACKPKVGGRCHKGARRCLDAHTSLYCENDTWQLDACKGSDGCKEESGQDARCVNSGALDGDPCLAAFERRVDCSGDRKRRIWCQGGKYRVEQCKGPGGCTPDDP